MSFPPPSCSRKTRSKINYIDPRITVAWAKKHDVPVEKLLSKVLIDKFQVRPLLFARRDLW